MFSMNRLSTEKRAQIIGCLVEGMSMRAISRTVGVARNTIDKLLVELGEACADYQDATLANLDIRTVEADDLVVLLRQAEERPRRVPGHPRLRRRVDVGRDRR